MSNYTAHRARLIAYLTNGGLSTARANANLDALLAAAPTGQAITREMKPEDVPHDLVMAGVRAAGPMSADSVRAVLAAVLPLTTYRDED